MQSTDIKIGRLKTTAAFAQSTNGTCIWDAVDGRYDGDPTVPRGDGDYRCYCWPPATEIAVPPVKRVEGQVSEPDATVAQTRNNFVWGAIIDIEHKHWELAYNDFLVSGYNRQASVIDNCG